MDPNNSSIITPSPENSKLQIVLIIFIVVMVLVAGGFFIWRYFLPSIMYSSPASSQSSSPVTADYQNPFPANQPSDYQNPFATASAVTSDQSYQNPFSSQ